MPIRGVGAVVLVAGSVLAQTMAGADRRPTVLLSPAAASFDMFEDYAARGRAFTDAVVKLGEERLKEIER